MTAQTQEEICPMSLLPISMCAHCTGTTTDLDLEQLAGIPATTTGRHGVPVRIDTTPQAGHTWRILDTLTDPIDCLPDHRADSRTELCPGCAWDLQLLLEDVPALLQALGEAERRDVRLGSGGRGTDNPIPANLVARDAAIKIRGLQLWAAALPTADHAKALSAACIAALRLVDRPTRRIYLGECPNCSEPLWSPPDAAYVECPDEECGWSSNRPQHVDQAIADGLDRWVTLTEALAAIDHALSKPQIDWWAVHHLIAVDTLTTYTATGQPISQPCYRLGDILTAHNRQQRIDQTCRTLPALAADTGIALPTLQRRAQRDRLKPRGKNHAGALLYDRADIKPERLAE